MHDHDTNANGFTHRQVLVIFSALMLGMVLAAALSMSAAVAFSISGRNYFSSSA